MWNKGAAFNFLLEVFFYRETLRISQKFPIIMLPDIIWIFLWENQFKITWSPLTYPACFLPFLAWKTCKSISFFSFYFLCNIHEKIIISNKNNHWHHEFRSDIAYSRCSLGAHITKLPRHFRHSITKNLPEGHDNPYHHSHREEQYSQKAQDSLRLRCYFKRKSKKPSQDRHNKHSNNHQEVPRQPYKYHHRNEQQEQKHFKRELDDTSTSGSTTLLQAHTITITIIIPIVPLSNNRLPILIMIIVMNRRPLLPANITKVVATTTSHMITSRTPLHNKFALLALPVVQITLKILNLVIITLALMNW